MGIHLVIPMVKQTPMEIDLGIRKAKRLMKQKVIQRLMVIGMARLMEIPMD